MEHVKTIMSPVNETQGKGVRPLAIYMHILFCPKIFVTCKTMPHPKVVPLSVFRHLAIEFCLVCHAVWSRKLSKDLKAYAGY